MKKLLVKFDSNWADEMDIDGFQVMTEVEFEDYKKVVKKVFEQAGKPGWSFGIGTNEEIEYESEKDFLCEIKPTEISDEEYETFKKYFTKYDKTITYGFFPDIDYFTCYLEDFEDLE
jgi:hypothetical protein